MKLHQHFAKCGFFKKNFSKFPQNFENFQKFGIFFTFGEFF
jgi:hypothetical protein